MQKVDDVNFKGFRQIEANYSPLPHQFIDLLPVIKSLAEIKVLIYLLRHTWGYQEYDTPKLISIDEFVHGRRRKDGTRLDTGTGLSEQGVRDGLEKALAHEYITVEIDDSDAGRIKKYYALNMANVLGSEVQSLEGEVKSLDPSQEKTGKKFVPRSEKETIERNSKKITPVSGDSEKAPRPRNIVFDATACLVFGYKDTDKVEDAFVGPVAAAYKKVYLTHNPEGTDTQVVAAMRAYKKHLQAVNMPRDLKKIQPNFLPYLQSHSQKASIRAQKAAQHKERMEQNARNAAKVEAYLEGQNS